MYAKVTSLGVTGLAGYIVQVEADLSGGLPQFIWWVCRTPP